MTTNTTVTEAPVECRCGHFDRTIRHSCRLTRALAAHRADLLAAIRRDECRYPAECGCDDCENQRAAYEAEMSAPWCSICDGLGHTGEAHERGIDDGFEAWEAGR